MTRPWLLFALGCLAELPDERCDVAAVNRALPPGGGRACGNVTVAGMQSSGSTLVQSRMAKAAPFDSIISYTMRC